MHNVHQLFKLCFLILCLFTWAEVRQIHVGLRLQHYGDTAEYKAGSWVRRTFETTALLRIYLFILTWPYSGPCVRRTFETPALVCVFLFVLTRPYSCTRHAGKQYKAALRFPVFIVARIGVFCTYIMRESKTCLAQTRFMLNAWMAPQYARRNRWQGITSHPLIGNS